MGKVAQSMISQALVKELLCYDRNTGAFHHRITYGGQKAGERAGSFDALGYYNIRILGYSFKAHRVAWLYEYGGWPEKHLDHIDGNPANNAIANLREATRSENKANEKLRVDNSCSAWQARIGKGGQRKSLGYYSSPEEAHAAYMRAAKVMYGEFARAK